MENDFIPTHQHAKGGLYQFVAYGKAKVYRHNWVDAVFYKSEDGVLCCTDRRRWKARFTELTGGMDGTANQKEAQG